MTVPDGAFRNGVGGEWERKKKPEISLEWKDITIEIKYCGQDIPSEERDFCQYFPQLSDDILSSDCILERQVQKNQRVAEKTGGHTLTHLLEQNHRLRTGRSYKNDSQTEDDPGEKSDGSDLPENIDQHIDIKKLISLPNGGKKCHICGKEFTDTAKVKRHLFSHSESKPFKCSICGWGFHQKCNMERHVASHAKEGEGFPCSRCNSWFTTKSVLSLHMKDAHNEKLVPAKKGLPIVKKQEPVDDETNYGVLEVPFPEEPGNKPTGDGLQMADAADLTNLTCHLCGKNFVKKTNLKHHLMLHRGEKPHKCTICGWKFVQKCNLKKHMDTHGTGTLKCPHCDIMFASKGAVAGHVSIVHTKNGGKNVNSLDIGFDDEAEIPAPSLQSLKSTARKGDNKKKAGSPAMNWWKHLDKPSVGSDISTNGNPVEELAENSSLNETPSTPLKTTLNIPKVTPSNSNSITEVPCTTCNKTFPNKSELEKHMLIHNDEMKPYGCPICGWKFHLIHNMKRHLQTHEESGDIEAGASEELLKTIEVVPPTSSPLASPNKATNLSVGNVDGMISPESLNSSLDAQEQAAPMRKDSGHLKCHVCRQWFTESALVKHMEVHSADRPYPCPICGWRFKQMYNMKKHMITHSGAKPYSCDFCDKSYTDNYSLKQHVAKHHPGVASTLPNMLIHTKAATTLHTNTMEPKSVLDGMSEAQKMAALQIYQQVAAQSESAMIMDLPAGLSATAINEEEYDYDEEEEEEIENGESENNAANSTGPVSEENSCDNFTLEGIPETSEPMDTQC